MLQDNTALKLQETSEDHLSVSEVARQYYVDSDGDVEKAVTALIEAVRTNRQYRDELTEPLINAACYNLIRKQFHSERRKLWTTAPGKQTDKEQAETLAKSNLMAFRLPSGVSMELATATDLRQAEHMYRAQADDMAHKARWFTAIMEKLPDGKKVGQALTNDDLHRLRDEVTL